MKTKASRVLSLVILLMLSGFLIVILTGSVAQSSPVPDAGWPGMVKVDGDPLPSWNEGAVKQAIVDYVIKITDSSQSTFIPVLDRIATFDNDGTLWAEQPVVQELFAIYMVKKMTAKNPALKNQQPFKAVLENDREWFKKGGEKALLQLLAVTHTGMTEDEFERSVKEFFATAIYPGSFCFH